jgi:hypothetical protein
VIFDIEERKGKDGKKAGEGKVVAKTKGKGRCACLILFSRANGAWGQGEVKNSDREV